MPALILPSTFTGSLGRQALKSAGVGAGIGGLQGFLGGEDSLENRAANAALTGVVGAAGGAAAPLIARGVQQFVEARPVIGRLIERLGLGPGTSQVARRAGVSREALDIASEAVGADDVAALSPNQMLAEAGPTGTGMLDFLGQRPGPTQRVVREAVQGRVDDATQRVTSALDDVLGSPQGLNATSRQIAQATAQARDDAYTAAYNQVVDYASDAGKRIRGVLARVPARFRDRAVQEANELAQFEGVPMTPIENLGDDLSVMQLDYLKRALNEVADSEVTQRAGEAVARQTGLGRAASNVARDLRNATVQAVPDYATALQLGSDNITRQNALGLGARLLQPGTTREAVDEFIERASIDGNLPVDVAEAIRAGVRQQIDEVTSRVARTATDDDTAAREAIKAIRDLSSRGNRQKLTAVLGEEGADRLLSEIDEAATAFNLRATQAQNSRTAAREMIRDRIEPEPGVVRTAMGGGNPIPRAIQSVTGETRTARNQAADAVLMEVADLLTGPRGDDAMAMAAILQQAGIPVEQALAVRQALETIGRGTAIGAASPGAEAVMANQ